MKKYLSVSSLKDFSFVFMVGVMFFLGFVACNDDDDDLSDSKQKEVESGVAVAEDDACWLRESSGLDANDCYLFPESISKSKAHFFYFTCEENEAIPNPAEYCRIHIRGLVFAYDSTNHIWAHEFVSSDQPQFPKTKLRLWLVEDTTNPTWNQDHSMELSAELMTFKDKDNTNAGKFWRTYYPIYTTSFKAISDFLQSEVSVESSGVFITLHEDMHKVTGAPENMKAAPHRAVGSKELLASFLVAARDLASRHTNLHHSMTLSEASLSALKKWQELLSVDPYEDLKKDWAKFHSDRCTMTANYFVFWQLPSYCGDPITDTTVNPAETGPPPPPT